MPALGSEDAASANLANNLVFVSLSHPGEITACATTIRSHAARTVHARRQKSLKRPRSRPESESSDGKQPSSMTLVKQRGPIPQQYFQSILWPKEFDPFDSFLRSLAPNEDKLIRVFVQHRVLKAMSYLPDPKMSYISDLDRFWHCVTLYWVQTALWDSGMLDSMFLLTCRYIADRAPGWKSGFTHQALHYKRRCLREIEHSESFTDHVITTRMAMVADEVRLYPPLACFKVSICW
ncbi:hypothetical protein CcaCcLH18_03312 [Colletotrichum camelliae]|nr:hypothetical protein CcaCcLH18_03312 [Colletotrichum camelliae]